MMRLYLMWCMRENLLRHLRNVMRNFYSPLKDCEKIAPFCLPDRYHQILAAQHLQRIEQYHQYQHG